MRQNKLGLADLKKLQKAGQLPETPPSSTRPERLARKRSPFLPPSPAPVTPKAVEPAAAAARAAASKPATARKPIQRSPRNDSRPAPTPPATPALDEADRKLFLSAVRYVEKIKDPGRVLLGPVPLAPDSILQERRKRAAGLDAAKPAKRKATPKADAAQTTSVRPGRPLSDSYAPAGHDADDSLYLKAGHGSDIVRDLKRGKWPIGASLDLHGSTMEDARERFERFVDSCLTHDVKCVRIVHGKGYGSRNGDAVLKRTVRRWLTQLNEVIAYTECSEEDGGSGAVQVLLK